MERKIYGPYTDRKTGRQIVRIKENDKMRTQSYPRFVMEQKLGRELDKTEHVDHKDDDPSNNIESNFQILTQLENNRKSLRNRGITRSTSKYRCPICNTEFERDDRTVRNNQKNQGRRGPYCSRSCAGKAGRII